MVKLLSQPYPTEDSLTRNLTKAFGIGVFIGLFLLVFQPFGLDDWQTSAKALKILGFGGVTTVVMLTNFLLLPALFPRYFSDERWTVGKEIVRVLVFVLVIAVGNRLYLGWLLNQPPTINGWLWAISVTFLIGIFPTVGLVMLNYIIRLKKYSRVAREVPVHTDLPPQSPTGNVSENQPDASPDQTVTLVADNEKDRLILSPRDLLFVESSDNYCTVVYFRNGQLTKPLLRSSLSRLEKQLAQPHITRCHRSYVVNLDRVERVTGNAQGYKLHLLGGQFQIPVARQHNETLIAELKGL